MFTVTEIYRSDYRVKGSKFLGFLCPANSQSDVEKTLDAVKNEHPTATHHCYAYIINPNQPEEFANDDGEPGGTAGLPILNTLRSFNLMNVLFISVRYYGGTKLGKAGLIEAYSASTKEAVEAANHKKVYPIQTYQFNYDYNLQNFIDKLKNSFTLIELKAKYMATITLKLGCITSDAANFENAVKPFRHLLNDFSIEEKTFYTAD